MSCYVWLSAGRTSKGNADFFISKALGLTRGRARFKHGGDCWRSLSTHFIPCLSSFIGVNAMIISQTVLTPAKYWSFSHMHIYFGGTSCLQVFGLFWSIIRQGPWSSANMEKDEGQSPKEGPKTMLIRSPFMHIHTSKIAQRTKPTKMRSRYFGSKQSKWRFKEGFSILILWTKISRR